MTRKPASCGSWPGAATSHDPAMTAMVEAAVKELDVAKRDEIYAKLQRDFLQKAPFIMLLQNYEVDVMRQGVSPIPDRRAARLHAILPHLQDLTGQA